VLVSLNDISTTQSSAPAGATERGTANTRLRHTSNATIRYYASDHDSEGRHRCRLFVAPSKPSSWTLLLDNNSLITARQTPNERTHILTVVQTQSPWSLPAAEAETGGVFVNAQNHRTRATLIAMGHPQPSTGTPLVTDNSTSKGILKKSHRPKSACAWDMRYHWLKIASNRTDRPHLESRKIKRADYFATFPAAYYHRLMRYSILHPYPLFAGNTIRKQWCARVLLASSGNRNALDQLHAVTYRTTGRIRMFHNRRFFSVLINKATLYHH
jgi:hypothetical protein